MGTPVVDAGRRALDPLEPVDRAVPRGPAEGDDGDGVVRPAFRPELLTPRRPFRELLVAGLIGVALAAVVVGQANGDGSWTPNFYFDEMWRADFIRSGNPVERMLAHDTPVPLGWVALFGFLTRPIPYQPVVFRVLSAICFLLAMALLTALLIRIAERNPRPLGFVERRWPDRPAWMRQPIPLLAAPVGVALAAFMPPVHRYVQTFNNYTFEMLYVAGLLVATEALQRSPKRAYPAFCLLVLLAPLFVLGGLLAVPGVVLAAAWWGWRSPAGRRWRRLTALAATCVGSAFVGAAMWVNIYRPVSSKPSIGNFWVEAGTALGGAADVWSLLGKSLEQFVDGALGARLATLDGGLHTLAVVVLCVSLVVGVVAVARRWAWLLVMVLTAWLLSILASAVAHWPMTVERVNACWYLPFFAVIGFGFARTVLWFTPRRLVWAAVPVLALPFVALWFEPYAVGLNAFNRDLTTDLQNVAASPNNRNLVFQYHYLAHFYAHDALVNTDHGDARFEVVAQIGDDGDHRMFQPLDPLLRERNVQPGQMVWCVIPAEVGPEREQACRFGDGFELQKVSDQSGRNAQIFGFLVRPKPDPAPGPQS